jgi:uncharacterized phage protein (TIGR01671 family)
MREIKFRIWNKKLNEMGFVESIEFNSNFEPFFVINHKHDSCYSDDFILMQYTGLRDKNGTEIYEGDIVIAWSAGVKAICEVKWGRGRAGFFLYRKPNIVWNLSGGEKDYNEENVEVIGNIFQDGDLLDSEISKVDRD